MPSKHISFSKELAEQLEHYSKTRGITNASEIFRKALKTLFTIEPPNSVKDSALAQVVPMYFSEHPMFPPRVLYTMLFMFSKTYPKEPVIRFWQAFYLPGDDKNYEQLFSEITKRIEAKTTNTSPST